MIKADFATSSSLDIGETRSALKEAGIYPGHFAFAEAIYLAYRILDQLEGRSF